MPLKPPRWTGLQMCQHAITLDADSWPNTMRVVRDVGGVLRAPRLLASEDAKTVSDHHGTHPSPQREQTDVCCRHRAH